MTVEGKEWDWKGIGPKKENVDRHWKGRARDMERLTPTVRVMVPEVCVRPEGQLRPSEQGAGPDGSSVGGSHSIPHMYPNFKQGHWPRALGDSSPVPSLAPQPAWPTKAIRSPLPHLFHRQAPLQIRGGRQHPPLGWVLSSHGVAACPLHSEPGP